MINQTIIDNCFNRLANGECDRLDFYYKGEKKATFHGKIPELAFFPSNEANGRWVLVVRGYEIQIDDDNRCFVPFDEIREIYKDAY